MHCTHAHAAPYLSVRVKQAVGLVGEDLCEACKQSNKQLEVMMKHDVQ